MLGVFPLAFSKDWRLNAPCHNSTQQAQNPLNAHLGPFSGICSWVLLTAGAPIEEVGGHLPLALHLDHPSTLQLVALGS